MRNCFVLFVLVNHRHQHASAVGCSILLSPVNGPATWEVTFTWSFNANLKTSKLR